MMKLLKKLKVFALIKVVLNLCSHQITAHATEPVFKFPSHFEKHSQYPVKFSLEKLIVVFQSLGQSAGEKHHRNGKHNDK